MKIAQRRHYRKTGKRAWGRLHPWQAIPLQSFRRRMQTLLDRIRRIVNRVSRMQEDKQ